MNRGETGTFFFISPIADDVIVVGDASQRHGRTRRRRGRGQAEQAPAEEGGQGGKEGEEREMGRVGSSAGLENMEGVVRIIWDNVTFVGKLECIG